MRIKIFKTFCSNIKDNRRLTQFFKLPKVKMELEDKVYDRPEEATTVLRSREDHEIDKLDMQEKMARIKNIRTEDLTNKFFSNLSTRESIKVTESIVENLRLNKEFKFTNDFKQKQILNEYGNYDKYFENFSTVSDKKYHENDDGESKWKQKFQELNEKYNNKNNKDGEAYKHNIEEQIKEDISKYGEEFTFSDYLMAKERAELFSDTTNPRGEDVFEDLNAEEKESMDSWTRPPRKFDEPVKYDIRTRQERKYDNKKQRLKDVLKETEGFINPDEKYEEQNHHIDQSRLSPWLKEDIYQQYLEGWTVKDLSYKYGILPQRVKAVVFMRDFFWKHTYPVIGESEFRRRLESSLDHAKMYPYMDYGKDLHSMAMMEQGMKVQKISRGEMDCKPTKEVENKVSEALKRVKPKKVDHVPLRFVGKGPSGYMVKEMVVKRNKGSKQVSLDFKKYCYFKDKFPNMLPDKMLQKKELGPRIATHGL